MSQQKRGAADSDDNEASKKARGADAESVHVYQPCSLIPQLSSKMNELVEVVLPAKHLSFDAKALALRQLWGTDVYSDDSDLLAVLVHTGHVTKASKSNLLVSLRISPVQPSYSGSDRNGLRSRSWTGEHAGVSFKVERCLQHTAGELPPPELSLLRPGPSRQMPGSLLPLAEGPGQSFAVPPSCVIVFNLAGEPCYKYSLGMVADQGMARDRWTSTRLRREVLYLESQHRRFQLTQSGSKGGFDTYAISQVRRPHSMDSRAMEAKGVPLPAENVKVLHENLDWEELVWGPCYLRVRGDELPLARMKYMPHTVAS